MDRNEFEQALFTLDSDDRLQQSTARRFAREVLAPIAAKEPSREVALEAFRAFTTIGYQALGIPEEYGGSGASSKQGEILTEELSRIDAGLPLTLGTTSLFAGPILYGGTEEQKQDFMRRILQGDILGCYCQTESDAGSDVASISTIAENRNGVWILNGVKIFISSGSIATHALVLAHTDPAHCGAPTSDPDRHRDLTFFVVDIERAGSLGQVTANIDETKAGLWHSPTTRVEFKNCVADEVIGEVGSAWPQAMFTLTSSRATAISGQAIGCMLGALDALDRFLEGREQFSMRVADMAKTRKRIEWMNAMVEMARLLAWHGCAYKDEQPQDQRPWEVEASMAKLFSTEIAERVTSDAIQQAGGAGYIRDTGIEKFWRDARVFKLYEGTSEIQQLIIFRSGQLPSILDALGNSAGIESLNDTWGFTNGEEETAFRGRLADHVTWQPYETLRVLRNEFHMLVQRAWEDCPPDPQVPSPPTPWFDLSWALTVLEAYKLVLWKEAFEHPERPQESWLVKAAREEAQNAVSKAEHSLGNIYI